MPPFTTRCGPRAGLRLRTAGNSARPSARNVENNGTKNETNARTDELGRGAGPLCRRTAALVGSRRTLHEARLHVCLVDAARAWRYSRATNQMGARRRNARPRGTERFSSRRARHPTDAGSVGGFRWSLQRLARGGCDGREAEEVGSGRSSTDAFAGSAAGGSSGASTAFLGGDRSRSLERRCCGRGGSIDPGRCPVVS
jgi:hypothetical protein